MAFLTQLAETVVQSLGDRYHVEMEALLLQRWGLALPQAPPVFPMRYDAQKTFTWAMFGFNPMCMSYYEGGVKNEINRGCGPRAGRVRRLPAQRSRVKISRRKISLAAERPPLFKIPIQV